MRVLVPVYPAQVADAPSSTLLVSRQARLVLAALQCSEGHLWSLSIMCNLQCFGLDFVVLFFCSLSSVMSLKKCRPVFAGRQVYPKAS
jgi:hypothetical protein